MLLIGASGYIGQHVAKSLLENGYMPICPLRSHNQSVNRMNLRPEQAPVWDITCESSINKVFNQNPDISTVISCIASRTGGIRDSWMVDFELNKSIMTAAKKFHVRKFVLLSAICVQKPILNFQLAKLAFEKELKLSGLDYTIVRPTSFFKSLSGQIDRVRKGKKFILFDTGENTRTKPISENDLAQFIVQSVDNKAMRNQTISIGGPGPVFTQKDLGAILFKLLNKQPRYLKFPSNIFKILAILMTPLGVISKRIRDKAEFLKIAHYYATESMLVWDHKKKQYSAEKTTEVGHDTIEGFYRSVIDDDLNLVKEKEQKLF